MNTKDIARDLIHRLTSTDAHDRYVAAEEVTDVLGSLGDMAPVVAGVLAAARLVESNPDVQEAQLLTLDALHDNAPASDQVVRLLAQLDPASITGSEAEYMHIFSTQIGTIWVDRRYQASHAGSTPTATGRGRKAAKLRYPAATKDLD